MLCHRPTALNCRSLEEVREKKQFEREREKGRKREREKERKREREKERKTERW